MNEIIELLLNHRSIRKFEDKPLSKEQIEQIVAAATGGVDIKLRTGILYYRHI